MDLRHFWEFDDVQDFHDFEEFLEFQDFLFSCQLLFWSVNGVLTACNKNGPAMISIDLLIGYNISS